MTFLTGTFLIAMVAAAGPALIHLLNRRRYRTIDWAAMDFLREAIKRNKRLMEMRDLLLLILRTLAVALFVLAMAQPQVPTKQLLWFVIAAFVAVLAGVAMMLAGGQAQRKKVIGAGGAIMAAGIALFLWTVFAQDSDEMTAYSGEPVHAVIVIDNSLSMGYVELDKSLLDLAKARAREFIDKLPEGSEISILPLCGMEEWRRTSVDRTRQNAIDTLLAVEVADRSALASDGAEAALAALRDASAIKTKRVVVISDMQKDTWSPAKIRKSFEELGPVQVVQVVPASGKGRGNSWVDDFHIKDGLADAQAAAVFVGTLRHSGEEGAASVRVTLAIDDEVVDEQVVDLQPGQARRVEFTRKFDTAASLAVTGQTVNEPFHKVRLEIEAKDPLPQDNFREIMVPVVTEVPVVFIDQYGEEEGDGTIRKGETFYLRHLLTHRTKHQSPSDRPLVSVRRRRPDTTQRDDLKDARLVVMAGVSSPPPELVPLLREYVEQGGQLLIAAGGEFDPRGWNQLAWLEGQGILPLPLKEEAIGKVPTSEQDLVMFHLAPRSIVGELAELDMTEQERFDLFAEPIIFRCVGFDKTAVDALLAAERTRIEQQRQLLEQHEKNEKQWAELERAGNLTAAESAKRDAARAQAALAAPRWLEWRSPQTIGDLTARLEELVNRSRPRELGQYSNSESFAVRRDVGKGRIVMITTGIMPQWNTLSQDRAVLMFDTLMLGMIERTLPDRRFAAVPHVDVPIDPIDQAARFELLTPGSKNPIALRADPIGETVHVVKLSSVTTRGVYELKRVATKEDAAGREWTMRLSINGPSDESDLACYDEREFADTVATAKMRWVGYDGTISLEGETYSQHFLWKLLVWGVLIALLIEMIFLGAPHLRDKPQATSAAASSGDVVTAEPATM